MHGIDESTNYEARSVSKPQGNSWLVYKRLLTYVFEYKARMALSIVFAFFVAGSLGAIIVGAGNVVKYAYDDEQQVAKHVAENQVKVREFTTKMRDAVGWAPAGLDTALGDTVTYLRANRPIAIFWLCVMVIVLSLIGGLARFGQEYLCASVATFITVRLGLQMYENIVRLPLRFFEQHTSGEIIARMTNDCFTAGRGLTAVFMKLFREPFPS